MSDAWLIGRARELIAVAQFSKPAEQLRTVAETDQLLTEAQHRGEPNMIAQLLRSSAVTRLVSKGMVEAAEPMLDEMLAHCRRHGLVVLQANAHALRGRRLLLAGSDDAALTEAAQALAILDEELAPDLHVGKRYWQRMLANSLTDIALVLTQLGVYEVADQVMARGHEHIRDAGGPHEITVHLLNRARLLIGWGCRLERVADEQGAREKFELAASIADATEAPFRQSLVPRDPARTAIEQLPILAAAVALHSPGPEHLARLHHARENAKYPREQIIAALAYSRCLERADRREEAVAALAETRDRLGEAQSEPTLWLALVREYARVSGPDGGERTMSALEDYVAELESELSDLRESRINTLHTRREHERLTREHGAIAKQALQDPLTGLPNRRVLDERLRKLVMRADAQPLTIALIDLDGFKGVNDRNSHAEGDDVLRVVASTLRDALRGDDLVTRYGGDEFVVLLPGAPLQAAKAALTRAVNAVAQLPRQLSRGVTLSVGAVSVRTEEQPDQALARADTAMYEAKRAGGNQIWAAASGSSPASTDGDPGWPRSEGT
ncbi:diguanylate cyclase (GGDEF)-like protein [Tamaricihabitans halophyticus]|uniref:Diguanylate cyclase (GGDEF)-like protein n=1 Tax=Tamaricihabitans halophyticus TaxID=1262583 RepID=A0A4R2R3E0_9PSEU|nr:GGDEF domain-containing protein [Tamaricihabitans halophyticus]TCP56364.1 diguanylate cyclase (GGDEF)-like protein [Tamaricihabitans halophyticus]